MLGMPDVTGSISTPDTWQGALCVLLPTKINQDVPTDLEPVIIRCLAKLPVKRFQDEKCPEKSLAGCWCAGEWTEDQGAAW